MKRHRLHAMLLEADSDCYKLLKALVQDYILI